MKKTTKKVIGYCAVDSGQLFICDPCYLRDWKDGDYNEKQAKKPTNHYAEACIATLGEDMGDEVLVSGIAGTGVAVSTGYGDGDYPVLAEYEDDRVKSISIYFF